MPVSGPHLFLVVLDMPPSGIGTDTGEGGVRYWPTPTPLPHTQHPHPRPPSPRCTALQLLLMRARRVDYWRHTRAPIPLPCRGIGAPLYEHRVGWRNPSNHPSRKAREGSVRPPSLCLCCACVRVAQRGRACPERVRQPGRSRRQQLESKRGINMSLPFGCIPRFFRAILALSLSLCASGSASKPQVPGRLSLFRGLAGGRHWARPFVSCLALGGREQGIAAGGRRRFGWRAAKGGRWRGITGQYRETRRALRQ